MFLKFYKVYLNKIRLSSISAYNVLQENYFKGIRSFSNNVIYDISSQEDKLANLILKYEDTILFSGYIESRKLKLGYKQNAVVMAKKVRKENENLYKLECTEPLPLSLKYLYEGNNNNNEIIEKDNGKDDLPTHFPFGTVGKNIIFTDDHVDIENFNTSDYKNLADLEVSKRLKHLNTYNWMADYDNYNEKVSEEDDWKSNYGTPNPHSAISNVPCGGCGALLHCKDTSIPGYIPSEIYENHNKMGGTSLQAIICQRCYFLKNYNLALQVQVSPEEYLKVLKTVRDRRKALVILMVDLLDFPSSIWPGAADLLGPGRPIFIVGNKVDLLPQDGKGFLNRVAAHLKNSIRESGFGTADIKHVALISATTGFGVEDLITKLYSFWQYDGDVFLIGCTNVGKSSLFNALLQSDYCKSQAVDLIQRATISPWPGTTLNLLKFPILRPSGHRIYMRNKRLVAVHRQITEEDKLRKSQLGQKNGLKYTSLIGHIGRTFMSNEPVMEGSDLFSVQGHANSSGRSKIGIDENDSTYAMSKWCYDTPGVVQPEQLLHLLTAEELLLTLPKQLIKPQTFCLHPGTSIFIGGLGRLDYLEGSSFARFTVFCSSLLPVTICRSGVADDLYQEFLSTDFFAVPTKSTDRLKYWPGLKRNKCFSVKGINLNYSCADVVLSSAGWISIAGKSNLEYQVKAWVPEHCGIHLRDSLLPYAVSLRGKRIRDSPAYRTDRFYIRN